VTKEPTILFCIGATKAGTSWLYEYLYAHSECHLRSIKELRYFDTVENGLFDREMRRKRKTAESLRNRMLSSPKARMAGLTAKLQDVLEYQAVLAQGVSGDKAYLAYLTAGAKGAGLVADITPSYALLSKEQLGHMASVAPNARFLYLLRDPVARLWSHVRMVATRGAKSLDAVPDACFALLEQVLNGRESGMTARGDYAATLGRLRQAVDPSRLMVMFMEDMLTPKGLARLCEFLGIGYSGAAFDQPVHVGQALAMQPAQTERARVLLRPQYEFVARHFSDLPENWRRNMGEARL
jgi:hypothetical protein